MFFFKVKRLKDQLENKKLQNGEDPSSPDGDVQENGSDSNMDIQSKNTICSVRVSENHLYRVWKCTDIGLFSFVLHK